MPEHSSRLYHQRTRNRIMELMWKVARWQKGPDTEEKNREVGSPLGSVLEHFEGFYDFIPWDRQPYDNSTITSEEREAINRVAKLMFAAERSISNWETLTWDEFIGTGWPVRMEKDADDALRLMLQRGRFSEEQEEDAPSENTGWPWESSRALG